MIYAAFDVLWHGKDVRQQPIEERYAALEKLIGHDASATVFAPTWAGATPRRS